MCNSGKQASLLSLSLCHKEKLIHPVHMKLLRTRLTALVFWPISGQDLVCEEFLIRCENRLAS